MTEQNRSETAVRAVVVDDKRGAILRAAIKVFAEKGYSNSKVADIAKEAGIADGTVYLYFKSKDDILHSLFDRAMAEFIEEDGRELVQFDKAEDKLRRRATAEVNIQNKIRKGKKSSEENLEDYVELLDENADAENIKAEEIKRSSEEDLESLLKLAEELKYKVENSGNGKYIIIFRVSQVSLAFFTLLLLYFSYLDWHILEKFHLIAVIITFFISLTFIIIAEFEMKKIKNRSLPDKFALKAVLQLLREVHGTIAEREDWSILKRAEFRIRLSRFDLSEKKDSSFSFFS